MIAIHPDTHARCNAALSWALRRDPDRMHEVLSQLTDDEADQLVEAACRLVAGVANPRVVAL